ncbi:MAG: hypothetical protein COB04_06150 [Gammaproteobacteria bacterium]|nr:MAG: hypothetical protein COB04_06150 [Gammaproteobacteria bacterium]
MALAEQIKAETSSQKAANMPLDSLLVTTPPIIETKTSWGSVILAFIAGIAVAGSVGYSFVVEPLQQAVSFQADQKLTYMSQNRIDQSTFEPRVRALEMSNAAKAEKETVLMNTVEDLQAELAKYKNVSK